LESRVLRERPDRSETAAVQGQHGQSEGGSRVRPAEGMDLTANGQVLTGPWTLEVITGSITDEALKEYSRSADSE
jgi:hypothetical protein